MNHRRNVGRWTLVVRDLRLGPILLGYTVRLEDGPLYRGPFPFTFWWRPTAIGALNKGYQEAHS